ncbi:proline-rich acidic protein 1 isoform X3 [Manis pentadactyla]|uniref:proline-rich acidic protein 1 isoform X3 n=1 Tax=Manis pentadactyla TaxID=143292 RepID=UPI00255CAE1B|nr:proline-rich acidic protein 1 isoform X3 [Manis pentadactyla]
MCLCKVSSRRILCPGAELLSQLPPGAGGTCRYLPRISPSGVTSLCHRSGDPRSQRLLLVTSLAAMLLQEVGSASLHQVFVKTKGKVGPPAQDTEEAWGALAAEPPDGGWLRGQLTAPGLVAATWETRQGATAWPGTEDALGRVPSPRQGPEPDPDDRYHPWPEEAQDEAQPWSWVLPSRQELQGPEEDRDYIYHPRGTSWGP